MLISCLFPATRGYGGDTLVQVLPVSRREGHIPDLQRVTSKWPRNIYGGLEYTGQTSSAGMSSPNVGQKRENYVYYFSGVYKPRDKEAENGKYLQFGVYKRELAY